jgi:hypothetical protein
MKRKNNVQHQEQCKSTETAPGVKCHHDDKDEYGLELIAFQHVSHDEVLQNQSGSMHMNQMKYYQPQFCKCGID